MALLVAWLACIANPWGDREVPGFNRGGSQGSEVWEGFLVASQPVAQNHRRCRDAGSCVTLLPSGLLGVSDPREICIERRVMWVKSFGYVLVAVVAIHWGGCASIFNLEF